MWINGAKTDLKTFQKIIEVNGLIIKTENVPVTNGLGDSSIIKATFEKGAIVEIEFLPNEYATIVANVKN